MKGKEKCELLKKIRMDIAEKNGIKLEIPPCNHTGDCLGSCPRCESEVKYLQKQLEARKRLGVKPIVAGISAGLITVTAASCDFPAPATIQGDMRAESDDSTASLTDTLDETLQGNVAVLDTEGSDYDDTTTEIEGTIAKTEYSELSGDIAIIPDGDELYLDGDIAFPPDYDEGTDFEIAGELPLDSDEAYED